MKKLLAYVQGNTNPVGIYGPVGWLVMPISDSCVNVVGLIHDGARMSATTWRQVYSTISKELAKTPWQPVSWLWMNANTMYDVLRGRVKI